MPYIGKKPADIIATVIDTTTGTFSGEVDAGSLDVSGNADIDGITNLDNTDIDGTLDVSGNLTVDTNTLFVDSSNNRVGVGTTSPDADLSLISPVYTSGGADNGIRFQNQNNSGDAIVQSYYSGTNPSALLHGANIYLSTGASFTPFDNTKANSYILQNTNGNIEFGNANSGTASERMRIDSSGRVGIGNTVVASGDADDLVVGTGTGNRGITIYSANNGAGSIYFSDGTSGTDQYDGYIAYQHSVRTMYLYSGINYGLNIDGSNRILTLTDAGTERARIDSSGNLLVGKTTTAIGTVGFRVDGANGFATITRDGYEPLILNRKTSDGDIAKFQKDGTTVGSIAGASGTLTIGSTTGSATTALYFNAYGNNILPSGNSNNPLVARDASITLGNSSYRFKDLYLSGGVYLGGTGSANYLQDYEEGTWTPAYSTSGGSFSYDNATEGIYTKIGNVVSVSFRIYTTNATIGSGNVSITGLPFTPTSTHKGAGSIGDCRLFAGDHPSTLSIQANGVVQPYYRASANGSNSALQASELQSGTGTYNLIDGQITYQTS